MKNLLIKNLIILLSAPVLWTSCSDDDPPTSTITNFPEVPFTSVTSTRTAAEADSTYTFEFQLDDRQIVDVDVVIEMDESSTATEDVDFSLSTHTVSLLAFSGGGSFEITINQDLEPEGDETIVLNLSGSSPLGIPEQTQVMAFTIRDSIYAAPFLEMDWEGTFLFQGTPFTFCPNVDIDLFVVDGGGFPSGIVALAATAACPELAALNALPDGNYTILANLFNNGLNGAGLNDQIPLRISLILGGVGSVTFDYAQVPGQMTWDANTPSDPAGNNNLTVGELQVSGGTVTLLDINGTNIGSF